jgi:2,5-diamino-6-(ribosylamino)-4(3H)-pyrimidinone 5'-phosphate reductase
MSADGKIALPSRNQTRISNEEDMHRVHHLRNDSDAIIVGIGTILTDDPKLTVKKNYVSNPSQPLRVVLDSNFRTPKDAQVYTSDAPTMIVTTCREAIEGKCEVVKCGNPGQRVDLNKLLALLYRRGIQKIMVEGGETVIWEFLKSGLVDKLLVFISPMIIGGISSPTLAGGRGADNLDSVIRLDLQDMQRLGDGMLARFNVKKNFCFKKTDEPRSKNV